MPFLHDCGQGRRRRRKPGRLNSPSSALTPPDDEEVNLPASGRMAQTWSTYSLAHQLFASLTGRTPDMSDTERVPVLQRIFLRWSDECPICCSVGLPRTRFEILHTPRTPTPIRGLQEGRENGARRCRCAACRRRPFFPGRAVLWLILRQPRAGGHCMQVPMCAFLRRCR